MAYTTWILIVLSIYLTYKVGWLEAKYSKQVDINHDLLLLIEVLEITYENLNQELQQVQQHLEHVETELVELQVALGEVNVDELH